MESEGRSILGRYAARGFKLFIFFYLLEIAAFVVIAVAPFFPGEHAAYTAAANQLKNEISSDPLIQYVQIFVNNAFIAALEAIPGFGLVLFGTSTYNTARVVEALAINNSVSPAALVGTLMVMPHTLIELSAYALTVSEGCRLVASANAYRLHKKTREQMKDAAKFFMISLAAAFVILLVADVFEVTEIALGGYWVLLSVPFYILLVLSVLRVRRFALNSRS